MARAPARNHAVLAITAALSSVLDNIFSADAFQVSVQVEEDAERLARRSSRGLANQSADHMGVLEHTGEIGPAFGGDLSPSFRFDEEMWSTTSILLGSSSMSTIMARHQICERHFDVCWNYHHNVWLPGAHCLKGAKVCPNVLCTTWLEANCMRFERKCPQINNMCQYQAQQRSETGLYEADHEEPMVFLHIPKTAGTAIENAGLTQNVRWGRHRMYYFGMMPMPDGLYCTTHHVPPRHLPKVMAGIYKESEVFCVSRHPYERAISEYKYLLAVPWGHDKPGLMDMAPCSAEGLNHFLITSLEMMTTGRRYVNDCHMLPQSEFIFDPERQWCTDVLRFEQMPQAFDKLMEDKGYTIRLDHSENESGGCQGITRKDLNSSTIELLNQIYEEDFKQLGYVMDH